MNKARRKEIEKIITKLCELSEDLEALREEEQEYYDNMPEAIQQGVKGERAEEIIGNIADAQESIDAAVYALESAIYVIELDGPLFI